MIFLFCESPPSEIFVDIISHPKMLFGCFQLLALGPHFFSKLSDVFNVAEEFTSLVSAFWGCLADFERVTWSCLGADLFAAQFIIFKDLPLNYISGPGKAVESVTSTLAMEIFKAYTQQQINPPTLTATKPNCCSIQSTLQQKTSFGPAVQDGFSSNLLIPAILDLRVSEQCDHIIPIQMERVINQFFRTHPGEHVSTQENTSVTTFPMHPGEGDEGCPQPTAGSPTLLTLDNTVNEIPLPDSSATAVITHKIDHTSFQATSGSEFPALATSAATVVEPSLPDKIMTVPPLLRGDQGFIQPTAGSLTPVFVTSEYPLTGLTTAQSSNLPGCEPQASSSLDFDDAIYKLFQPWDQSKDIIDIDWVDLSGMTNDNFVRYTRPATPDQATNK